MNKDGLQLYGYEVKPDHYGDARFRSYVLYFRNKKVKDVESENAGWTAAFDHYIAAIKHAMDTMTSEEWNTSLLGIANNLLDDKKG